ncbi:MAG: hypothetical protein NC210_09200 [[Clostridium] fimetarium]|nr:hypothetical protein [Alistipes timonensis]MCM1406586.1 hypothetical protein [[Clostridium] fimetarium]
MKIFKTFAAALILLAGATACDSNDNPDFDPNIKLVLNPNVSFTTAKDLSTGEWSVFEAPTYSFDINTSTFNASLKVEKLTYAEGKTASFTISGLALTIDPKDNAWTISNNSQLVVKDENGASHEITGFNAYIFSSGRAPEIVRVEYTLDNAHKIRAVMKFNAFMGKTTVASSRPGMESFEWEKAVYFLILDQKTQKAKVLLYEAKFADKMPRTMDMNFLSHPFTVNDNGLSIDVPEKFEPENNNIPNSTYAVTDFKLLLNPCRTLAGTFTCGGAFDVTVDTTSAIAIDSETLRKMTVEMGK